MHRVRHARAAPDCQPPIGRAGRRLRLLLALPALAALGCQEDTAPPTAPVAEHSSAVSAQATLAFKQVSAGSTTCGVTTADVAYCWGWNQYGQVGDGTTTDRNRPRLVAGGLLFRQVSAGFYHTCGVTTTNRVYCWGYNDVGQLGTGSTGPQTCSSLPCSTTPRPVAGGLQFSSVSVGLYHTCAVTTAGQSYCWGYNGEGELGDGTSTSPRLTPVAVVGGHTFRSLDAGGFHTCAVTTSNVVYCWGANNVGQLGAVTAGTSSRPVPVAGELTFRQVSAGELHSCGVRADSDAAYCWGENEFGRLGDGTTTDRTTPTPVAGGLQFTVADAGSTHTCGRTTGNRLYCWGFNIDGKLGDGTKTDRLTPTVVAGTRSYKAVIAGTYHSCGLTTASKAYCWGSNGFGQLGDGTNTNRLTPTATVGP